MRLPRIPAPINRLLCSSGTKVRFRCGQPYGFPGTYRIVQVKGEHALVGGCGWWHIGLLCEP